MSKYDKLDFLVYQGKRMSVDRVMNDHFDEKKLESFNKDRIFRENRDPLLFDFGISLFENGYLLEDFMQQLEYWSVYGNANEDEIKRIDSAWMKYVEENFKNVTSIPSYTKILEMLKNPGLFVNVENGYNVARRRSLATSNTSKEGKVR